MYHDFNIPCPFLPDRIILDKLKLILSRLSQFNECTIALNYTIDNVNKVQKPSVIDTSTLNTKYPLTIIKRVTIDTDIPFDNEDIERIRKEYDLVALKTRNSELFQAACSTLKIDIISFHFDERLSFELDSLDIKRALERCVYFEICYAPAIKDKQAKLYTLQIAKQLFDYTKGRQWIISSGTESVSEVRNPFDIFYFAKSLGLANDSAKFTIEKNCEQVLLKAKKKQ